jgi:tetratricopeptide (TPR) repeat protein
VDVRRVAAVTLGMVGDMQVAGCLTRALRDEDEQVNQMAEYALWSIWFRAGDPKAVRPFCQGISALSAEAYTQAIEHFHQASIADPTFAEVYNQQGIAHYFLRQWPQSLANCAKAVRLVPAHFGAIAGMGHCYTQMGDLTNALQCYRRALSINPRMSAIEQAIVEVQNRIRNMNDSSGIFSFDHVPA